MIYKIPIYFEVEVQGDFDPNVLNQVVEGLITERSYVKLKENWGFPLSSRDDIFDNTAETIRKKVGCRSVKVHLIPRQQVFEKMKNHTK